MDRTGRGKFNVSANPPSVLQGHLQSRAFIRKGRKKRKGEQLDVVVRGPVESSAIRHCEQPASARSPRAMNIVIASAAKQSSDSAQFCSALTQGKGVALDCFVASLLAMTKRSPAERINNLRYGFMERSVPQPRAQRGGTKQFNDFAFSLALQQCTGPGLLHCARNDWHSVLLSFASFASFADKKAVRSSAFTRPPSPPAAARAR